LGAYEAFYIHAILFKTRSAVVSVEWVSTALEQISRDLSGDALAQIVGGDIKRGAGLLVTGLVALRTTGQQPARYSTLGKRCEIEPLAHEILRSA
jgi:hypothetical protein